MVPAELDGVIVSSHYFLFTVNETKLMRDFLGWYVRTPAFRDQVQAQGSTNYAAVRPADVLGYEIPVPSLAEQRRIVARIEELTAKIAEARSLREKAMQECEALGGSTTSRVLAEVANSVGTPVSLRDVCELITDGTHDTPAYVEEGVPLLTAKNVFWDHINVQNVRYISRSDHEEIRRRCPAQRNDVLFINIGATTGTAKKLDIDLEFSLKNVALLRAGSQLDCDYLVYLLKGPAVRQQITDRQAQTCQPFLALKDLRSLSVSVPGLSQQRRIVAHLDAMQAQVNALKKLQTETAAELDALIPSIIDKAFRGEL